MATNNRHITILGAGESGVGSAILAKKHGFRVLISDAGKINKNYLDEIIGLGIEWEEGGHNIDNMTQSDVIIKSPGIPSTAKIIQDLKIQGKKIIGEIEFAKDFTKAKHICITGSNGKTTTSMLTYHILKKAGLNVKLGGNVGESYAKQVAESDPDWFVLELSSFQLEDMYDFKANVAVLLNITPDHLDRYEYNLDKYIEAKLRILQNQTDQDWFIFNLDDPNISKAISSRQILSNKAPFSIKQKVDFGGYLDKEQITINIKEQFTMSIHELALKGKHNAQNSLAAGITSRILEIRKESIRESLSDFVNVEHRLEFVAKVHGIEFINDSKATNINSTWFALESMDKPTVWIVGGIDKGNDYSELFELVKDKVKAIICLGTENNKILEAFQDRVETIVEAKTAMEAVAWGYRLAQKDETVLLSPACASFDLFENYEHRGNEFKKAVRAL